MKMSVGVLDHYNVSTRKLNETVHFYENVLGFTNGPRPPFNFPGAAMSMSIKSVPCAPFTATRRNKSWQSSPDRAGHPCSLGLDS